MAKILCVRYIKDARIDYVDPLNNILKLGDGIVLESEKGEEIAKVIKLVDKDSLAEDLNIKKIIRIASKDDYKNQKENDEDAREFLKFARKEAEKLKLEMKFLSAEYTLDRSKLTLYFTAEDRVDFRELVRILAQEGRTRIELRQIGPRDELKMFSSLGMCGKECCCRTHLQDFKSVTIKDAKEQGLQINMDKLSGTCGKLMCCLKYEEEAYKENQSKMPKYGESVKVTKTGEEGKVYNLDILKMKVKVKFGNTKEDEYFETYDASELSWKNR